MTPIETLLAWLIKNHYYINNDLLKKVEELKVMEKQNIIEAFEIGYENGACTNENESIYHGSNYYNKTFKSN